MFIMLFWGLDTTFVLPFPIQTKKNCKMIHPGILTIIRKKVSPNCGKLIINFWMSFYESKTFHVFQENLTTVETLSHTRRWIRNTCKHFANANMTYSICSTKKPEYIQTTYKEFSFSHFQREKINHTTFSLDFDAQIIKCHFSLVYVCKIILLHFTFYVGDEKKKKENRHRKYN